MIRRMFVLLATAMLVGCGQSPSNIVIKFYMDVAEGRIEDALAAVDLVEAESKGLSKGKVKAGLVSMSDKLNKVDCGKLKEVNVVTEDVRGELASQKVELVCKTGKKITDSARLIKSKDGWRISLGYR